MCLLIRREALLCSVELLNLEAKARVSSSAAGVVAESHRKSEKVTEKNTEQRAAGEEEKGMFVGDMLGEL